MCFMQLCAEMAQRKGFVLALSITLPRSSCPPLGHGGFENAYFNAERSTRVLILMLPKGGLPGNIICPEKHRLKA